MPMSKAFGSSAQRDLAMLDPTRWSCSTQRQSGASVSVGDRRVERALVMQLRFPEMVHSMHVVQGGVVMDPVPSE
jgi:hypothetical protein